MFSTEERFILRKNQLGEVICQLRFPTILSIGAKEPAEFQDSIRAMFPLYAAKQEQLPPKVVGMGTQGAKLEPQAPLINYHFISADNIPYNPQKSNHNFRKTIGNKKGAACRSFSLCQHVVNFRLSFR